MFRDWKKPRGLAVTGLRQKQRLPAGDGEYGHFLAAPQPWQCALLSGWTWHTVPGGVNHVLRARRGSEDVRARFLGWHHTLPVLLSLFCSYPVYCQPHELGSPCLPVLTPLQRRSTC